MSSNNYQSAEENNQENENNLEIDEFGNTEELSYPHEIKYLGTNYDFERNIKRPIFMIKFTDGFKYPTLEGDYIEWMPYYLSSGTSYTTLQKGKLSCFVGITYRYYDDPEILKEHLSSNLKKEILDFANKNKKRPSNFIFDNLIKENFYFDTWFGKLNSSYKYDSKFKSGYKKETYDTNWPGYKDVYSFLGEDSCKEKINDIIKRTGSGRKNENYNQIVKQFLNKRLPIIPLTHRNDYEDGIRNKVNKKRDMISVRYCVNERIYSLRNRAPIIDNEKIISDYEINKMIGSNNLFGSQFSGGSLNLDSVDTGLEFKYKRCLVFFIYNTINYVEGLISLEELLLNFNTIISKYSEIQSEIHLKFEKDDDFKNEDRYDILDDVLKDEVVTKTKPNIESLLEQIIKEIESLQPEYLYGLYEFMLDIDYLNLTDDEQKYNLFTFIAGKKEKKYYDLVEEFHSLIQMKTCYIFKINKVQIFLDILESIFDYITNPDGTINYSNADKYNFPESNLINFLTIPLYNQLKIPTTSLVGKKKRSKKLKKKNKSVLKENLIEKNKSSSKRKSSRKKNKSGSKR